MSEGTPKAIEMKGIVRNATKIGVQDGQAEDLINLRFVDGSWRASGNGRQIVNMPTGTIYQQLYVHTNVYHHLLGVDNGTLYWFAEIDNDGVTFTPLAQRVPLTTVVGDVWITQTGHLLTVIDENDDFECFVFKTGEDKYIEVNMDVNGKQTDRSLYPFGKVHLNSYCPCDPKHIISGKDIDVTFIIDVYYDTVKNFVKKRNQFAQPFIAVVAAKLYDGSYSMASNPMLIHPREKYNFSKRDSKGYINLPILYSGSPLIIRFKTIEYTDGAIIEYRAGSGETSSGVVFHNEIDSNQIPDVISLNAQSIDAGMIKFSDSFNVEGEFIEGGFINYIQKSATINSLDFFFALGSDLMLTLDEKTVNTLKNNADIITSLCVFVTTEADLYKPREKDETISGDGWSIDYHKGTLKFLSAGSLQYKYYSSGGSLSASESYSSYSPEYRDNAVIINDLLYSPLYLLREYKTTELNNLLYNPIIDLSTPEHAGLLENLVQQQTLPTEALSRTTYLPKVSYMYNGRLHIADYKSHPFFGYPIDLFHLHNHSVKVQDGAWFPADADGQRVLPNLADNNDEYLQYPKDQVAIKDAVTMGDSGALINAAAPYFLVKVYIDTAQGEQIVSRYIPAYNPSTPQNGRADFIEDLNPLLTYPDVRAKKMEIYYIHHYSVLNPKGYYLLRKEFTLKPHPYMNMAYYIDPELKPIKLSEFEEWPSSQPLTL